jgi:serine/threonine protein kinase
LARGYNMGADWWCLGVLTYVLLTGRQPFTAQNVTDPMKVMKRIVDLEFEVSYPPYLSPASIDFMNQLLERRPAQRLGE